MPESLIITTNTSGNKEGYCWLPVQRILLAYRDRAGGFADYWWEIFWLGKSLFLGHMIFSRVKD